MLAMLDTEMGSSASSIFLFVAGHLLVEQMILPLILFVAPRSGDHAALRRYEHCNSYH